MQLLPLDLAQVFSMVTSEVCVQISDSQHLLTLFCPSTLAWPGAAVGCGPGVRKATS